METFNSSWVPDQGMTADDNTEDYIRAVKYGEGAVQLQKLVLGDLPEVFNLSFSGPLTKIDPIDKFVKRNQGKRFLWTPPGYAEAILVYCSKRTKNTDSVSGKLSYTFTQVLY